VLDPDWGGPDGWVLQRPADGDAGSRQRLRSLPEVYRKANPRFTGRVTVPALWDRPRRTIVNNESAEIMRMLEVELGAFATGALELYPEPLRAEIDEVNAFAATQAAYGCGGDRAVRGARRAGTASRGAPLPGRRAPDRSRPPPVRDARPVRRRLLRRAALQPAPPGRLPEPLGLHARLYHLPGIAATVRLDHVKRHYWDDHPMIDRRIVPIGPEVAFDDPPAAAAA
jgi:glutathionyl-hydroquinone reductase